MNDTDGTVAGHRVILSEHQRDASTLVATLELQRAAMVEASIASNADDEHDPEGATIAFERAQLDATIADVRHRLGEFAAALSRLENGTYGTCVICGLPIPAARLEARPSATVHVACAP